MYVSLCTILFCMFWNVVHGDCVVMVYINFTIFSSGVSNFGGHGQAGYREGCYFHQEVNSVEERNNAFQRCCRKGKLT